MAKIDMHIHSNISDGSLSPIEIFDIAKQNNCEIISITDHDIFNDYSSLEKKYSINIISGIEFNTSISNMHILGYNIKNKELINKKMLDLRKYNENVCLETIEKLEQNGYDVSKDKVIEYLKSINLSYDILDKRKLVKYLIYKGYSNNVLETYNKLIGKNQKFYVPNKKNSSKEVIELVKECGGFSSLAHPNTLQLSNDNLFLELQKLKEYGLEGIEVINGNNQKNKTQFYKYLAQKLELLETYGSDFHEPKHNKIGIDISEIQKEKILKKII